MVFWCQKIHARKNYRWTHPVHEVLTWVGPGAAKPIVTIDGIQLDHHPDPNKSRGQYLPLLELSVKEDPDDDRNVHYLGREYFFYHRWEECIATLMHHLSMPTATWKDERSASMRYIAKSCLMLGDSQQARNWYLQAIAEAPHLREPYMDLAQMLYESQEWDGVLYFTECALSITQRPRSYICEAAPWGSLPHDLRCMAFYHTGRPLQALEEARLALTLEPENSRLQGNVTLLEQINSGGSSQSFQFLTTSQE